MKKYLTLNIERLMDLYSSGCAWIVVALITHTLYQSMSGYKNFAIVGAGAVGNCLVHQFLKDKAVGTVNQVVVLTRQVSPYSHDYKSKVFRSLTCTTGIQDNHRWRREGDPSRLLEQRIYQGRSHRQ